MGSPHRSPSSLALEQKKLSFSGYLFCKRLFDILFSAIFLLVFSPFLLFLSLFLWVSYRGSIFYKSTRLGRRGKIIHCWKFRTMHRDAEERLHSLLKTDPLFRKEWEVYQKVKEDPRITKLGKFLRKYSLDELPQFWNVLKGDLSVVGPRPPVLQGPPDSFLRELNSLYGPYTSTILSVRPGLTGVWQVSGRSNIPFSRRGEMEAQYIETASLFRDLWLVVKTIPAILFSRGAC